jgi:hypothetical protein
MRTCGWTLDRTEHTAVHDVTDQPNHCRCRGTENAACRLLGASARTVCAARKLIERDDDNIVAAVDRGELAVYAARDIVSDSLGLLVAARELARSRPVTTAHVAAAAGRRPDQCRLTCSRCSARRERRKRRGRVARVLRMGRTTNERGQILCYLPEYEPQ